MKKKGITIALIIPIVSVFIAAMVLLGTRYKIVTSGDGIAYKIDSWSGNTWVLIGESQFLVTAEEEEQINDDYENTNEITLTDSLVLAIEKVKSVKSFDYNYIGANNEHVIRDILKKLEGDIQIYGWKSERINEQIFLVWYEIVHNEHRKTIGFEYNSEADLIRTIKDDAVLKKKYQQYLD